MEQMVIVVVFVVFLQSRPIVCFRFCSKIVQIRFIFFKKEINTNILPMKSRIQFWIQTKKEKEDIDCYESAGRVLVWFCVNH